MTESRNILRLFQTISRYTGMTALIPAGMGLISVPIAIGFAEYRAAWAFALMSIASLAVGGALYAFGIKRVLYNHYQIFWIMTCSWALVCLLGSIPYSYIGTQAGPGELESIFASFYNALFESVSGFTTTGLTMVAGHEAQLQHSIQWWRSFSQWVGGIGIIVAVIVFIHSHRSSRMLVHVELGAIIPHHSTHFTAMVVWGIYCAYTVLVIGLFSMTEMSLWQAINYGMAGISTGGFGVTNNSMGDFGQTAQLVSILPMILGAMTFAVHQRLFRWKIRAIVDNEQFWWFIGLLFLTGALLAIGNWAMAADISGMDLLFQAATSLTTTGFNTGEIASWPIALLLILIAAMVIGGCQGSTAGGIKVSRLRRLVLEFARRLRQLREDPEKVTDTEKSKERIELTNRRLQAFLLTILWMLTLMLGVFSLSLVVDAPLEQIVFEAVSALSVVGLSAGITDPEMNDFGKTVLMTMMWLGRLEIIPVLAILLKPFYIRGGSVDN